MIMIICEKVDYFTCPVCSAFSNKRTHSPGGLTLCWFPTSVVQDVVIAIDCNWSPTHQIHVLFPVLHTNKNALKMY